MADRHLPPEAYGPPSAGRREEDKPVIPTIRDDIKSLKGVHLWHFAMSNCSQRVRMALTEKGVPWTSHHVDLPRKGHPCYRGISAVRQYRHHGPPG